MGIQMQIYCPECHHNLRLKVVIEDMFSDFYMYEKDKKLYPKIVALKTKSPKIKLSGYHCGHCGLDCKIEDALMKDMANQVGKFRNPLPINQFMLLLFGMKASGKIVNQIIVHKENKDGIRSMTDYMKNDGLVLLESLPVEINNRKKVLT